MLQIITGKFFKTDRRIRHDGKGVLYSNYNWIAPIGTSVGTLEPIDPHRASVVTYVFSYVNQIERVPPPGHDVLVRAGDEEIVEQFQLLCTFGLRAFFHTDNAAAGRAFRAKRTSRNDNVPSEFVKRFLSPSIDGTQQEVEAFTKFVDHTLMLPRRTYVGVMSALKNFSDALQVVGQNIDLSYSMMVYCLEALAQNFDGYTPRWEHYAEEVRKPLDQLLAGIEGDFPGRVRETLLKDSHLALRRRFVDFIISNLDDSFFVDEAPQGFHSMRRSELEKALGNAYEMRSRYAHRLVPLLDQLTYVGTAQGDFIRWDNKTYPTLSCMARLVHHVGMRFILSQPTSITEELDWRSELPNVMRMQMAPEYWVHKMSTLDTIRPGERLGGYLDLLQAMLMGPKREMTNMSEILVAYEDRMDRGDVRDRMAMISNYVLYNAYLAKEHWTPNCDAIRKKYDSAFDTCAPEVMLTRYLFGDVYPWPAADCDAEWRGYVDRRHHKGALRIPPLMEVGIILEIGRRYLEEGNIAAHAEKVRQAILDAAGWINLQRHLGERTDWSRIGIDEIYAVTQGRPFTA